MTIKKLLRIGDKRLTQKSQEVKRIDDSQVVSLIDNLWDSMGHYGGVGIAAPQIGTFLRVVVFGFESNDRYPDEAEVPRTVLINPQIEVLDTSTEDDWEGCLSVPFFRGLVPRFKKIRYCGLDENGNRIDRVASDFHARLVQHEVDHLDGILFPMRIKDMTQFGCEDLIWEELTGQPYPEQERAKLPSSWQPE